MAAASIFSNDRQSSLTIERIETDDYYPSQQLRVSVVQGSFSGATTFWCEEGSFRQFVEQLRECERLRRGEANLIAMFSEGFSLRIFNTRAKGDFAFSYQVCDSHCSLSGEFDLDAGFLLQILRDVQDLTANFPTDTSA